MTVSEPIIALSNLSKRYGDGDRAVWALRNVSLSVAPRELVTVSGPSGSGKTTLLNLISGLDFPTSGEVRLDGQAIHDLPNHEMARLRRRLVTMVFQFFNLLPTLTAAQNVAVPLRADRKPRAMVAERTREALEAVGMSHRADRYPGELSGGEMQRVAIARAIATDARIILADEPTGNLDTARGKEILELLRRASEEDGRAIVLVTHDPRAAAFGDREIILSDGRIAVSRPRR